MLSVCPPAEDQVDSSSACSPPAPAPKIELDSDEVFPTLVDRDGWQVVNPVVLKEQEASSKWRDRCALVADMPVAELANKAPKPTAVAKVKKEKEVEEWIEEEDEEYGTLDQYELRHKCGQRRAKRIQWGKSRLSKSSASSSTSADGVYPQTEGPDDTEL